MKSFIIVAALAALLSAVDFDSAVLVLSGASSMEELDESTIQHYRDLELHPLELNGASRSRLLASGLFTAFQVASFFDWKSRSGDVLSYVELGLLDGFTPEKAEALQLFTRLESSSFPGARRSCKFHNDLMLRGAARENDGRAFAAGVRWKGSLGDWAEFNWASRNSYSAPEFGIGTLSGAYYGRRILGKLVLGHFNARFGQGLAMWSGMSMSRYSSLNAFRRNGSGFTSTASFSPSHCGVAADFDLGKWNVAAAYSFIGNHPMAAVSYCGKTFSAGAFASDCSVSADFKWGLKNTSIFGEVAWNGSPAALAGVIWTPVYKRSYGLTASWAGDIWEVAAGADAKNISSVILVSNKQLRAFIKYSPSVDLGTFELKPSLRVAARKDDNWRLESRGEFGFRAGSWRVNSRLDLVHCKALSGLYYLECGYDSEQLKIWLRGTAFCVDNWDDRIYVYERDAPGCFNVPAYYGRGWSASLAGTWKMSACHRIHIRISYLEYPWMTVSKVSKAEVKIQYELKIW